MDKKEQRDLLLELLNDKKVLAKLYSIIDERENNKAMHGFTQNSINEDVRNEEENNISWWKKFIALKNFCEQQKLVIASLQEKINMLENKNQSFEQKLQVVSSNANEWKAKYKGLEDSSNKLFSQQKQTISDLQEENENIQTVIKELKNDKKALEIKLAESFDAGRSLYESYQSVNSYSKQLLSTVFPRDSFESFICGGAKEKSLEKIWDVTQNCCNNGEGKDANLLYEIFVYFINLVNNSYDDDVYALISVSEGDVFDSDIHIPYAGSRAQGNVNQVVLPGYMNLLTGNIVRKSVVYVE